MRYRFVRFALVGIGAVGLNLLLFALLVGCLGIQYLVATVVIFLLGNGYGFLANRRWVFGVSDHAGRRMVRYYATMAGSLGLNLLSMAVLVDGLKLSYLIASAITSAWLAPVLYLTHGRVAFRLEGRPGTKTRLLLVTNYYEEHGGGVEIVAGRLAALLGKDFDIEWCAAGTRRKGHRASFSPPAEHVGLPTGGTGPALHPLRCWNGLERRLGLPIPIPSPPAFFAVAGAARAADIVWVHDLIYPANLIAAATAIASRRPLVVTAHVGPIPYRSRVARQLMAWSLGLSGRWLLTRAAAVAFVSERVRAEFRARWRLRDGRLIPNGVDFETFTPPTGPERERVRSELDLGDDRVVLFVGRFVDRKGLPLLHELAKQMPTVHWLLAGHGPLDPDSWLLPNVTVCRDRAGRTLAELYGAADMLALPSLGEGFPLVVGEALAVGLPVLVDPSTVAGYGAVAAVAESEPVLGADAVTRWAARIGRILEDDTGRAAAAPRRVEFARSHWDWDRAAAEYSQIFAEILRQDHVPEAAPAGPLRSGAGR
jgi:glycosyltransferase involved in cell wall biosynthesis/putative flippase GtrA